MANHRTYDSLFDVRHGQSGVLDGLPKSQAIDLLVHLERDTQRVLGPFLDGLAFVNDIPNGRRCRVELNGRLE